MGGGESAGSPGRLGLVLWGPRLRPFQFPPSSPQPSLELEFETGPPFLTLRKTKGKAVLFVSLPRHSAIAAGQRLLGFPQPGLVEPPVSGTRVRPG